MPHPLAIAAVVLIVLLGACSAVTPSEPAVEPALVLQSTGSATTTQKKDPVEILQAEIEGDLLKLEVSYGGGCARHDFSLLFSGVFMQSFPMQTHLDLAHDAHGDPCRAIVGARPTFDLTPLKLAYQAAHGERGVLVLHLRAPRANGFATTSLRYEF